MSDMTAGPEDEGLHPIGEGEHWQESWYFNWADQRHDVFGLTRIGFRFRQRQIDGLILTIRKGRPEYAYPAVNIRYSDSWSELTAAGGLSARGLVYKMEEPLKRWRLTLQGRDSMDLVWTAFTPVFDYHASGGELPPNVTGKHFEQSGRVTGWTDFKSCKLEIDGMGQRDKSWGVRDWARVEGWDWISAQFGEDLSFNVWDGLFEGKRYKNGFVFIDGENHTVENVIIKYSWGRRNHIPAEAHLVIEYATGGRLEVTAQALGQFPLLKKGLWIQESHAKFTAVVQGRSRDGIGVIEHARHIGKMDALARIPEAVGTMYQVFRR